MIPSSDHTVETANPSLHLIISTIFFVLFRGDRYAVRFQLEKAHWLSGHCQNTASKVPFCRTMYIAFGRALCYPHPALLYMRCGYPVDSTCPKMLDRDWRKLLKVGLAALLKR
jgi:hypothetical protein